jgi:hypothetical protein
LKLGFDCNRHTIRGETLLAIAARADGAEAVRLLVAAGGKPDRKNRRGKRESARQIAAARRRGPVLAALGGETTAPAPSERAAALARTLRAAAKKLTPAKVRGMASNFGMTKPDPAEILERSLAKFPERPEDILADVASEPVFDRFVVARLLRDAGLGRDVRLTGLHILADSDLTVSGDLVVEGVLVDELGKAAVVVAGDLDAHVVVTEADMLVGGELRARDFVWGNYSDGTLAVAGAVTTPLLVLTNHTCECGSRAKSGRQLVDPDDDELTPLFVPTVLKDGSLDRHKVLAHLRKHAEVLRTEQAGAARRPADSEPALSGAEIPRYDGTVLRRNRPHVLTDVMRAPRVDRRASSPPGPTPDAPRRLEPAPRARDAAMFTSQDGLVAAPRPPGDGWECVEQTAERARSGGDIN